MHRRPFAALVSLLACGSMTAAAGCDTGDGKAMRPPTSAQRAAMTTTTSTSTTTTLGALPPDAATGAAGSVAPTPVPIAGDGSTTTTVAGAFALTVPWPDGGAIDARFTCDGADVSPLLTWTAPPAGTVELALLVTDDAAAGYVHWVVAGIPPTAGEKGEGATITGAVEGVNDFGTVGWRGPCPPPGAPHTYRFTLLALDQQLELPEGFTGHDVRSVAAAALAAAEGTGTYARAG